MKSLRETVEKFTYSHMEYLLDLVDTEEEKAMLGSFPCTIDHEGFGAGTLLKCAVRLYLNEHNTKKKEKLKAQIVKFSYMINEDTPLETWGKLALLGALNDLKSNKMLDIIPSEMIELFRKKTDYTDFFDKATVTIPQNCGKPTNYYHVALSIATLRELLGFDEDGMSEKIADKLITIMKNNSGDGWMDETPPHGRFDSYSMGSYRAVSDALSQKGKDIPDFILKNAKKSAMIYFAARNRKGHGFKYGRSLSIYGETGALAQVTFALKYGLIEEVLRDEAISYIIHICDRLINFWFNKEMNSFDIWTGDRSTDVYRGIDRLLCINLEMCMSLMTTLEEFTRLGIDNYIPKNDVSLPEKWEIHKTVFIKEPSKARSLYVLRRGEHSFMLPLVGVVSDKPDTIINDTYFPFPTEQEFVEAPVWRYQPFLVPEVIFEKGKFALPIEAFETIEDEYTDDGIIITANGKMIDSDHRLTDVDFEIKYIFYGDKITVRFEIMKPYNSARILFAAKDTSYVSFIGAEREEISDVSDDRGFRAACGGIRKCKTAYFNGSIAYEISL